MNKILFKILRTHPKKGNQFWQTFEYEGPVDVTISSALKEINSREKIIDTNLDVATQIIWEEVDQEENQGAMAMLINQIPTLADLALVKDVVNKGEIELRPLTKFPIIADLKVDKSLIKDGLKEMAKWIESKKDSSYANENEKIKCISCGCCLEVCTNYTGGDDFENAMKTNLDFQKYKLEKAPIIIETKKKKYTKKFMKGCSKSKACEKICPVDIAWNTDFLDDEDISVWRIWQQK